MRTLRFFNAESGMILCEDCAEIDRAEGCDVQEFPQSDEERGIEEDYFRCDACDAEEIPIQSDLCDQVFWLD